jgi:hypothetical protein
MWWEWSRVFVWTDFTAKAVEKVWWAIVAERVHTIG